MTPNHLGLFRLFLIPGESRAAAPYGPPGLDSACCCCCRGNVAAMVIGIAAMTRFIVLAPPPLGKLALVHPGAVWSKELSAAAREVGEL